MAQELGFFVIGVDGGGSKTVAVLADGRMRELGRGQAGPSNYQVVGIEAAQEAIRTAVRGAFEVAGLPPMPVRTICLGMAGVGRAEDRGWVDELARSAKLAERVIVANDGQLLLWAGTPEGVGVGVISGTGSIAYGRAADGREARNGGWGYIMGDEGSGYWLGRAALQAVAQAADGRGQATSLTGRILKYWGLTQPGELVAKVYRNGTGRVEIAELAGLVFEEAQAGDATALRIEGQAARDLAEMAMLTASRLRLTGMIPCALGGGVLANSTRLAERVVREALKVGVKFSPVKLVSEPVKGALRLALGG